VQQTKDLLAFYKLNAKIQKEDLNEKKKYRRIKRHNISKK
jgi:hypothetical protein